MINCLPNWLFQILLPPCSMSYIIDKKSLTNKIHNWLVTSVTKKSGQTTVAIQYYSLSKFIFKVIIMAFESKWNVDILLFIQILTDKYPSTLSVGTNNDTHFTILYGWSWVIHMNSFQTSLIPKSNSLARLKGSFIAIFLWIQNKNLILMLCPLVGF